MHVAMPNYRRASAPGGTYFFTVAIAERSKSLLVDRIDDLRDAFRAAHGARPLTTNVCFWSKPVLAVKHFPAVIPGLADGETRATKSLLAVGCAMPGSLRNRDIK